MDVSKLINIIIRSSKSYPEILFNDRNKTISFINPLQYYLARQNWDIYSNLDYIFIDGISVVKIFKLLYGIRIPRLSFDMTTMAKDLFEWISHTDKTIYFIGSKQEDVEKSVTNFQISFPNIQILGYRNGYFYNEREREQAIEDIIQTNPSYVIVGMGSVVQEKFALDLKNAGFKGLIFTCGGFLHQSVNRLNYYPRWVDKYNLRAIYRLFTEKGVYKKWGKAPIVFSKFFIDFIPTKKSLLKQTY